MRLRSPQAECGEQMAREPVDVIVHALAEVQTIIVDYDERRGRNRSAQATIDRLRAIFEDPALVSAMETLGQAPIRVVARLRVIEGGATDKKD
jgi:hypothetical protein